MGMSSFNENKSAPGFGLFYERSRNVSGLERSPRNAAGALVPKELNLGQQLDQQGSFPLMYIMIGSAIGYQGTAHAWGFVHLNNKLPGTPISDSLEREALVDAYNKLYKKVANVADLIRTRKESMNMAINMLRRLTSAARAIRHGNIHRASSILGTDLHKRPKGGTMSERWLEYAYGWSPLLSDLYNILDKGFGDIKFEVVSRKKELNENSVSPFWEGGGSPWRQVTGSLFELKTVSCKIKCKIPNTAVQPISNFGLDNPLELAWEALPYSFVIDWFIPIGDYLAQSGAFASSVQVTEMSITKKIMRDWVGTTIAATSTDLSKGYKSRPTAFSKQYKLKTRSNTVRARPLPSFNSPFQSIGRYLNQLALFNVELNRRVVK